MLSGLQAEQLREHGFRSHEQHNIYLESQADDKSKQGVDKRQIRDIVFRSGKVAGELSCHLSHRDFGSPSSRAPRCTVVGMHRIPPQSALLELYRWEVHFKFLILFECNDEIACVGLCRGVDSVVYNRRVRANLLDNNEAAFCARPGTLSYTPCNPILYINYI